MAAGVQHTFVVEGNLFGWGASCSVLVVSAHRPFMPHAVSALSDLSDHHCLSLLFLGDQGTRMPPSAQQTMYSKNTKTKPCSGTAPPFKTMSGGLTGKFDQPPFSLAVIYAWVEPRGLLSVEKYTF